HSRLPSVSENALRRLAPSTIQTTPLAIAGELCVKPVRTRQTSFPVCVSRPSSCPFQSGYTVIDESAARKLVHVPDAVPSGVDQRCCPSSARNAATPIVNVECEVSPGTGRESDVGTTRMPPTSAGELVVSP